MADCEYIAQCSCVEKCTNQKYCKIYESLKLHYHTETTKICRSYKIIEVIKIPDMRRGYKKTNLAVKYGSYLTHN